MNLPNFKDVLKIVLDKLSILKNNMSVMISIIIAFIALLLFIPTQLLSSNLKKEIQSKSISALATKLKRVEVIPDEKLDSAKTLIETVVDEANSIELLAEQTSKRELLRNDIFNINLDDPNISVSQTIFREFGMEYCGRIDQFMKDYHAGLDPTSSEIQRELEAEGGNDIFKTGRGGRSYSSNNSLEQQLQGMMIEQICQRRAEASLVYIDPAKISGYSYWKNFVYDTWEGGLEDSWYSQLGYWIIEDILDTIAAMNSGHESLINAPVKRLMKINFTSEYAIKSFAEQGEKTYTDKPQYILSTEQIPKETLTGRYCNENYDVVHFNAKLVVSSKDIPAFLSELCSAKEHKYIDKSGQTQTYQHNQITVLGMTLKSVDMRAEDHQYCNYGDANVSEVELTCEYIFNKKGYDDVKPQSVKDYLDEQR